MKEETSKRHECQDTEKRKRIFFRCDGNAAIGSGHVMRCLSIAAAASGQYHVVFLTADNSFCPLFASHGYEAFVFQTDYTSMEAELEQFLPIINEQQPDAVFVDSYYVTAAYLAALQQALQPFGGRLIYLDDVMAFAYPADILVNYNIYGPDQETKYRSLYENAGIRLPQLLLGTSYAPLRREFSQLPQRKVNREAAHILVSTGGADAEHVALQVCRCMVARCQEVLYMNQGVDPADMPGAGELEKQQETDAEDAPKRSWEGGLPGMDCPQAAFTESSAPLTFHFIIGALNQDKEQIETLVETLHEMQKETLHERLVKAPGENAFSDNAKNPALGIDVGKHNTKIDVKLHYNVSDMQKLMSDADLAISAAGSTLYELCATQTPTVTYVLADNQIPGAEGFVRHGILCSVGDIRTDADYPKKLLDAALSLAGDYEKRCRVAKRQRQVVDGAGAGRILADCMRKLR